MEFRQPESQRSHSNQSQINKRIICLYLWFCFFIPINMSKNLWYSAHANPSLKLHMFVEFIYLLVLGVCPLREKSRYVKEDERIRSWFHRQKICAAKRKGNLLLKIWKQPLLRYRQYVSSKNVIKLFFLIITKHGKFSH